MATTSQDGDLAWSTFLAALALGTGRPGRSRLTAWAPFTPGTTDAIDAIDPILAVDPGGTGIAHRADRTGDALRALDPLRSLGTDLGWELFAGDERSDQLLFETHGAGSWRTPEILPFASRSMTVRFGSSEKEISTVLLLPSRLMSGVLAARVV